MASPTGRIGVPRRDTTGGIGSARPDVSPGGASRGIGGGGGSPGPIMIPGPRDVATRSSGDAGASAGFTSPAQAAPTRNAPQRLPIGAAAPIAPPAPKPAAPAVGPLASNARIVAPAAVAAGGAVLAASASYWDHNRSVMSLTADTQTVRFAYEQPRPGLGDLGIKPGSILFVGRSTGGNAYAGDVTTFSRQCGDTTFPVAGEATSDGARLIVYGQKPSRDRRCNVTGYKPETLLFELRQVR